MAWLSQNWIWIGLAVAAFFLMHRMHWYGMGHSIGRGHGGGHDGPSPGRDYDAGPPVDPVSRRPVAPSNALVTALYGGRAYHFENRENRDTFEGDPDKYLTGTSAAGPYVETEQNHRQHRRHGC